MTVYIITRCPAYTCYKEAHYCTSLEVKGFVITTHTDYDVQYLKLER